VLETAREGHVDVLSAFGFALAAAGFARGRGALGHGGVLIAALAKLNGLVLVPLAVAARRQGAALLLPGLLLLALPYFWAASADTSGLAAYATRWRAGDGAFGVALALAEAGLGGDWVRLDPSGVTVTRHQVARALVAALFGAAYILALARPGRVLGQGRAPDFHALGGLLLLLLLLLAPTFHPWYALWLLPFAALGPFPGRAAALWLAVAAAALHHPTWLALHEGAWRELPWVRALVHLPAWGLLMRDFASSGLVSGPGEA
jgi:hypothetical protein